MILFTSNTPIPYRVARIGCPQSLYPQFVGGGENGKGVEGRFYKIIGSKRFWTESSHHAERADK